jgi:hypothetical protein
MQNNVCKFLQSVLESGLVHEASDKLAYALDLPLLVKHHSFVPCMSVCGAQCIHAMREREWARVTTRPSCSIRKRTSERNGILWHLLRKDVCI